MNEYEQSGNLKELFEQKFDQLLSMVSDIKNTLAGQGQRIDDIKDRVIVQEQTAINQQKEIDELKAKNKTQGTWIAGLASGIILAIVGAVVKMFIG